MDLDAPSYRSRDASMHPFGGDLDDDLDLGAGGIELGDLGISFDGLPGDNEPLPPLTPSRACKCHHIHAYFVSCVYIASPLTEPPRTPPPADVELAPQVEAEGAKAKRQPRAQKQIIDDRIDLETRQNRRGAVGLPPVDVSSILTDHGFLPRSPLVMRLMEIRDDPVSHFLPTKNTPNGTFFCAAPPGMSPELAELFMRPMQALSGPKRRGTPDREKPPSKRPRIEGSVAGDDEDVENARRAASAAPSIALGSDILGGRANLGPGIEFGDQSGMVEDFQMDIPEFQPAADDQLSRRERSQSVLSELSRLSTPAPENAPFDEGQDSYADVTCPIAMFDERSAQSQEQANKPEDGKGYSKNTVKALRVIRHDLHPEPQQAAEKVMSFNQMSEKASRRAASSFFFELLVLGTRDCVKLDQAAPYENIEIRAKDKLWERQRHNSVAPSVSSALQQGASQRQASVAPSIASALGL